MWLHGEDFIKKVWEIFNCCERCRLDIHRCSHTLSSIAAIFSISLIGQVHSRVDFSTNTTVLRTHFSVQSTSWVLGTYNLNFFLFFFHILHCLSWRLSTLQISFPCLTTTQFLTKSVPFYKYLRLSFMFAVSRHDIWRFTVTHSVV